jgi:L-methionine (R)-S-oxide reductase
VRGHAPDKIKQTPSAASPLRQVIRDLESDSPTVTLLGMNELLAQIKSLLKSDCKREAVLEMVLREVLRRFHSETGTIHLLDQNRQLLHLCTQVGLPPQMLSIVNTIPVGKGIAGQTVARGGPVTICNLQTDTSGVAKPGAKQTGVGGALCVPLRHGDVVVGTIGVGTTRQYEYTPEETQALETIGRLVGEYVSSR